MVMPFMSIYCTQQLHYTIEQAGMVMAMFGAGAILGTLISGRITDRVGFYPVQVVTLLLGGSMFFVIQQLTNFIALCIGTFFLSLCNESFRPANSTAIAYYSKEENRTRSYSLNRLAINLGFSVGGMLGGFLASKNYHWLFWVDGATNISAAILMLKILPVVKVQHKAQKQQQLSGTSPYKDKNFLFFVLLVFLFAACFLQMFGIHPVFLKTYWHISEQQIGVLMALNGILVVCVEMVLIHRLEGRRSPMFYIGLGAVLMGLGFITVNILPASFAAAAVCIILITFGEIFSMPFMNTYWISRTQAANRGSYAALYATSWSAANVIAPVSGAAIASWLGFNVLWWVAAAISLSIAGLCVFLKDQRSE